MNSIQLQQTLTVRLADGTNITVASDKANIVSLRNLLRHATAAGNGLQPGAVVDGLTQSFDYVGDDDSFMEIFISEVE